MTGQKSQRTRLMEARRTAREAQGERRRAAREREGRVVDLATEIIAALDERGRAISACDHQAGTALVQLIDGEGMTAREVVQVCGGRLDVREVMRLTRTSRSEEPA